MRTCERANVRTGRSVRAREQRDRGGDGHSRRPSTFFRNQVGVSVLGLPPFVRSSIILCARINASCGGRGCVDSAAGSDGSHAEPMGDLCVRGVVVRGVGSRCHGRGDQPVHCRVP